MLELPLSMPSFFYYGAFDGLCLPEKKYANLEKTCEWKQLCGKRFINQ